MDDPRLQALLDQLDTILIILQRPVVQRQLGAFVIVFLISWVLPAPLGVMLKKLVEQQTAISRNRKEQGLPTNEWRTRLLRVASGLQLLLFPIVGWAFSQLTVGYFVNRNWPGGLLDGLTNIFWLLLIYRTVGSVLYGSLEPATARTYQRRFVTPIFLILVTFVVSSALSGTFPIIGLELFQILETPISVQVIALAVVVFYLFLASSWITQDILRKVVLPRAGVDSGVTNAVLVSTRYALVAMGVIAALSTIGFDLSAMAIVFGGLSVGIGFGLQELVANFISGILLLFEQSLRPGDVIEVGGQRGTVSKLGMRATVLRTLDNIEIFVPNKTLLTSTVSTYTLTDRTVRRIVTVGVSYNSDPTEVRDILQRVMESHGRVMDDPAPVVFFQGFGNSSLDFQCAFWIDDPARGLLVDSDVRYMIFREFDKNDIEIPFPQQDLHVRSAEGLSLEALQGAPVQRQQSTAVRNGDGHDSPDHHADKNPDKESEFSEEEKQVKSVEEQRKALAREAAAAKLSPDRVKAPAEKPKLPG